MKTNTSASNPTTRFDAPADAIRVWLCYRSEAPLFRRAGRERGGGIEWGQNENEYKRIKSYNPVRCHSRCHTGLALLQIGGSPFPPGGAGKGRGDRVGPK